MSALTLCYVHGTHMGYARAGTNLADCLTRLGVDVYDDQGPSPVPLSSEDRRVAEGYRCADPPTDLVCWVSVPTHARWWWKQQHAVILTMWEASVLPEAFRSTLHEFDRVLVPSRQNVELFSRYHDDVRFLPLGVADQWRYRPRPEPGPDFRFLIAGSGARKGTDLAFDAFKTVFGHWFTDGTYTGPEPRPWLVMKNPRGEQFWAPWVEMVTGRLTDDEEVDLYASCHAYLGPSRGEGFGLQPLQAIAQGMPTVLTNAHGHESYAHLGIPIGWSWSKAAYFIYGDAGEWWEPDFDELCEAIWDLYTNYAAYLPRAKESAAIVDREWRDIHTAARFIEATRPWIDAPRVEATEPKVPQQRLYLVRVIQPYRADIGGCTYLFEPGRDYWEPADVKRILFEAGRLDPSCLTVTQVGEDCGVLDAGLTESQIDRIGGYQAEHAWCPTCGQRMNTQPTRADDLLAKGAAT